MTTQIKVIAHCSSDKQVKVRQYDVNTGDESGVWLLNDGDQREYVVFDDRAISVCEVLKEAPISE